MLSEIEHEVVKAVAGKTTAAKGVGAVAKVSAVGLDKEALRELATAKVAAKGTIVAGGVKGATVKSAGATLIPADPVTVAGTIWTGKGLSLGLGLGLGPLGPALLVGILGVAGYHYWKFRNKVLSDEALSDEGFMDEDFK